MSTPSTSKLRSAPNRTLFLALGIGGGLALLVSIAAAVVALGLFFGVLRGGATAGASPSPSGGTPGEVDDSDLTFESDHTLPADTLAALSFTPPQDTDWVTDADAPNDADTMSYVSESTGCQLRIWQSSLDSLEGIDVTSGDDRATSRAVASSLRNEQIPDDAFAKHTFTGGLSSVKVDFVDVLWGESDRNYLAVRAFGDAGVFVSLGLACTGSSAWDAVKKADAGLGVVTLSK
jgi:hypothetical protein